MSDNAKVPEKPASTKPKDPLAAKLEALLLSNLAANNADPGEIDEAEFERSRLAHRKPAKT